GELTRYEYNHAGDRVTQVSPTGLRTSRTVDDIGRTRTITTANSGGAVFGTTTYDYDAQSRIATQTDPAITNPITGVTHTKVTTYAYDKDGNVTSIALSDATGGDAPRVTSF